MKKSNKQPKETDEQFLRRIGLWSADRKKGIQHSNEVRVFKPINVDPKASLDMLKSKKTKVVEVIKKK